MMKSYQVSRFANFFMVGVDHKRAPIDVRERFTLDQAQTAHMMHAFKSGGGDAMFVLSTCNRTEVYAFGDCPRKIIELLCTHTGMPQEVFYRYQHILQNSEAISHLFRVGAGLESKILGDFEIIGQIKKDYLFAKEQEMSNAFLERLVNSAIQASKRVKNETELSTGASSVAFAAVQAIKAYLGESEMEAPKVLLVGTGKIGRTACENLINQTGLRDITLLNRTEHKAQRLADRFQVAYRDMEHLSEELNESDVILVATGAREPIVHASDFKIEKPRLLLDLSVPRNVAADLYRAEHFSVLDVDHLHVKTQESIQKRLAEVPKAESIIAEVMAEFQQWLETRKLAPTLQAVRRKMESWKIREVQNMLKRFPDLKEEQVQLLADQMLNRLTGQLARQLKSESDLNGSLRTIHHIFELEKEAE